MTESATGRSPAEPNSPLRHEPRAPIESSTDYGAIERRLGPSVGRLWFLGKLKGATSSDAMMYLVHTFPSLRGFEGPWDTERFIAWMHGKLSGERLAARFVLSVWNPEARWASAGILAHEFNLHEALSVWDAEHLTAFVAWAREPWWP